MVWLRLLFLVLAATASASFPKSGLIPVGAILPLTGQLEPWGRRGKIAIELALEDISKDPTLLPNATLQLYYNDSQTQPTPGLLAAVEQIRDKGVLALLGPYFSTVAKPVAMLSCGYDVPIISPTATSGELSDKQFYPYFTRTVTPDNFQARALVDWIYHNGWRSVSLIHTADDYGTPLASYLQQEALAKQTTAGYALRFTSILSFSPNDEQGVRLALETVKRLGMSRVVLLICFYEDAARAMRAARDLGMTGEYIFLGTEGWVQSEMLKSAASEEERRELISLLEGASGTLPATPDSPALKAFLERCSAIHRTCADDVRLRGVALC